jgi:hypothetical protein
VRDFSTRLIGDVAHDSRHAVWMLWHTRQALTGHATWPWTTQLHYPYGVSTLVDGVGPLNGILALPFWYWGPAAAYNGTALAGIALSGWCQYFLVRSLRVGPGVAFFAGALFMMWPIHLIATHGHIEKLFVGLLPLTVLAGLLACDPDRRWRWTLAPGAVLLLALLQNGNQFAFGALGLIVIGIVELVRAPAAHRGQILGRLAAAGVLALIICAPLLIPVYLASTHPLLLVKLGVLSSHYSPDLLHILLPSPHQLVGTWLYPLDAPVRDFVWPTTLRALAFGDDWYGSGLETAVTIPLTALTLCVIAWRDRSAETRRWLIFGAVFTVLTLGPWLRAAGYTYPELPLPLPYQIMLMVPGLDIMRTPGRFMMMASVGLAAAAALGLARLCNRGRWPRTTIITVATLLALIECWPRSWRQTLLPPVPAFYSAIAADTTPYAVLDLPHGWHRRDQLASAYMYYVTIHHKPIAWSYVSRFYTRFPVDGIESLWNPEVTDHRAARSRLRALGYRYVVWHKHVELFTGGQAARPGVRGAPAPATSDGFIRGAFEGESPVHDDELVTVFLL